MSVKYVLAVLCFIGVVICADGYKILVVLGHPGRSHWDVVLPLVNGLADKGHDVTVLGNLPLKDPNLKFKNIILDNPIGVLMEVIHMEQFQGWRYERYINPNVIGMLGKTTCHFALQSPAFHQFLKQNYTFDVIISESFNRDCFLGLVHKYQAPLIAISTCTLMSWSSERFGDPTHPAYIPNLFLGTSTPASFLERVESTVIELYSKLFYNYVVTPSDEQMIRQYFGQDTPPLRSILLNSSLMLVNTHFSLNLPRPHVPSVIEIGGIHLAKPKKLPKNLEKWINESAHGVIYFSLGSMIKGHTFPDEKRRAFLKAFGRLPQRVLWKWENETMPEKPENVMIQKWMPQLDILCHPNVVAFISHGGLLGTTEAVHCGVPIVVMPQYGDQHTNAKALEANGGGVILKLREATEEMIYDALKKVLDPGFRKGAKELSARFRDRPLPPLETAIYWVEYVARHKGAHHMRTAAVGMPFYKYLLLDVVAFLLAIFVVWVALSFYCVRAVWRRIFRKRELKSTAISSNSRRTKQD